MKKLKALGAISFALIGGGALVSIPLAITSCGKTTTHAKADKYITWDKGSFVLGNTEAQQNAGLKVGSLKVANTFIIGKCEMAGKLTPTNVDHIWLEGADETDRNEILVGSTGKSSNGTLLPDGTFHLSFSCFVYDIKNTYEEVTFLLTLTVQTL